MRYKGLNSRQSRFVDEYIFDLNATKAAIRAGYAKECAQQSGSQVLSSIVVQQAIQRAQDRIAKRLEIKADRVVKEEAVIAFSDLGDVFDFTGTEYVLKPPCEIPEHARRAIQSIKVKRVKRTTEDGVEEETETVELKLWSKDAALGRLKAHLGIADKLDVDLKAKVVRIISPAGSEPLDATGLRQRQSLNGHSNGTA